MFQLNGLTVQGLKLRFGALGRFFSAGSGEHCRQTLSIYRLAAEAHMLWLTAGDQVAHHTVIRFPLYVGTKRPAPGTPPLCGPSG
jgi:hypothetical protein